MPTWHLAHRKAEFEALNSLAFFILEVHDLEVEEGLSTNGRALLGGKGVVVKMDKRTTEGVEEADL